MTRRGWFAAVLAACGWRGHLVPIDSFMLKRDPVTKKIRVINLGRTWEFQRKSRGALRPEYDLRGGVRGKYYSRLGLDGRGGPGARLPGGRACLSNPTG